MSWVDGILGGDRVGPEQPGPKSSPAARPSARTAPRPLRQPGSRDHEPKGSHENSNEPG